MKVLLKQNIDTLGKRGEIIEVADGYARNFLLPKNLALKPTPQNVKQLSTEKRRFLLHEAEEQKRTEALSKRLKEVSCTIVARADQDGHLYGSVTPSMIVEALAEHKVELEPRCIHLEQAIKELGVYNVEVRLHPETVSQLKVWVVEETEEEAPEKTADAPEEGAHDEGGDG